MISYELALQLKNAGFPQEMKGGSIFIYENKEWVHTGGGHLESGVRHEGLYAEKGSACCDDKEEYSLNVVNIYDDLGVKIPTLPELIEACGDKFDSLRKIHNNIHDVYYFVAFSTVLNKFHYEQGTGSTPEEAVANLYIGLNKK
jgi:hypothetical protein